MRPCDYSRTDDLCRKCALAPSISVPAHRGLGAPISPQPLNLWESSNGSLPLLENGFSTGFNVDMDTYARSGSNVWNDMRLQPYHQNEHNRQEIEILASLYKLLAEI